MSIFDKRALPFVIISVIKVYTSQFSDQIFAAVRQEIWGQTFNMGISATRSLGDAQQYLANYKNRGFCRNQVTAAEHFNFLSNWLENCLEICNWFLHAPAYMYTVLMLHDAFRNIKAAINRGNDPVSQAENKAQLSWEPKGSSTAAFFSLSKTSVWLFPKLFYIIQFSYWTCQFNQYSNKPPLCFELDFQTLKRILCLRCQHFLQWHSRLLAI